MNVGGFDHKPPRGPKDDMHREGRAPSPSPTLGRQDGEYHVLQADRTSVRILFHRKRRHR